MKIRPKVCILVLGGTITMRPMAGSGIAPSLTGEALLAQVPSLQTVADIHVETPFLKPGASLSLEDIGQIARRITELEKSGYDGVVVVQGTDTIDETSFLLDILLPTGPAVVVTGAMRGADAPGADGPANLVAALRVASDIRILSRGVVVVLNDEIHAASQVEKTHTSLSSAFASPNTGPLGIVAEERVILYSDDPRGARQKLSPVFAPVVIAKVSLGDDDRLIRALPALGYRGVVVEAMGAGHVPAALVNALGDICETMPVVLTTRVAKGPIYTSTYGFAGSEIDLRRKGLISAGHLRASKARLLLSLLLGNERNRSDICSAFEGELDASV